MQVKSVKILSGISGIVLCELSLDKVQVLLEKCTSIKVKRLSLFMAEKAGHQWFSYLDLNKIGLGNGKRMLVKDGVYIPPKFGTKMNQQYQNQVALLLSVLSEVAQEKDLAILSQAVMMELCLKARETFDAFFAIQMFLPANCSKAKYGRCWPGNIPGISST